MTVQLLPGSKIGEKRWCKGGGIGSSELHGERKIFDRKTCALESRTARSRDGAAWHALTRALTRKLTSASPLNFPGAVVYRTYDSQKIIS